MKSLTDAQISDAIEVVRARDSRDFYIESLDTVRIAYEWLDAQRVRKSSGPFMPLKHVIEAWGARYVSTSAVQVAAYLHPRIAGRYPGFNLSSRFTRPNRSRLAGIREAGIHADTYGRKDHTHIYKLVE